MGPLEYFLKAVALAVIGSIPLILFLKLNEFKKINNNAITPFRSVVWILLSFFAINFLLGLTGLGTLELAKVTEGDSRGWAFIFSFFLTYPLKIIILSLIALCIFWHEKTKSMKQTIHREMRSFAIILILIPIFTFVVSLIMIRIPQGSPITVILLRAQNIFLGGVPMIGPSTLDLNIDTKKMLGDRYTQISSYSTPYDGKVYPPNEGQYIDVTPLENGSFHVTGKAYYFFETAPPGFVGNYSEGDLDIVVSMVDNRAHYETLDGYGAIPKYRPTDPDEPCVIDFVFKENNLDVTTKACILGGINVSFDGEYAKTD